MFYTKFAAESCDAVFALFASAAMLRRSKDTRSDRTVYAQA
jgi:hypothetical protein